MEALISTDQEIWYGVKINPEPWAIGSLSVGRRNGKVFPSIGPNAQLVAFQEAIREEFDGLTPEDHYQNKRMKITFYFWRNLSAYKTPSGRTHRKHVADATNMQKALEDALQGILFHNDRTNRDIRSVVVKQGHGIKGKILIHIEFEGPSIVFPIPVCMMLERLDKPLHGVADLTHDTGDIF